MYEFKLPDVGEGMHEAEVLEWLVQVGDTVAQDQVLVDIQTDKATVQLPAPVAGRIAEIRVKPGTLAHVGDVLVVIATDDGRRTTDDGPQTVDRQMPTANWSSTAPDPLTLDPRQRRILAAPAVRRLALQLGVDLAQVTGTGPVGRVLPEDVRQFVEENREPRTKNQGNGTTADRQLPPADGQLPPADGQLPPADGQLPTADRQQPPADWSSPDPQTERIPLQGLRRRIAERMEQAWRVPHVTSVEEVDVTGLVALKQALQPEAERRGVRLTYTPIIVKVVTRVLREFPYFNATLDMPRQEILLHRHYHVGVATAIPDGLVVPVVRHADHCSLLELAAELARLAEAARTRTLKPDELTGSTFTVTNFGSFGGLQGTPIINPPEVAILGCGRIEQRAVVVDGQIAARPIMPLALSFDHRLIDGAAAAQFLGRVKALLSAPQMLLLDCV